MVKEIGQVVGDSVSGLGVKAKNIRRPTSANEVVCEECCCYHTSNTMYDFHNSTDIIGQIF